MSKGFENKMEPPAPAPQREVATGTCVLGPTLHFKGELYGEEDLEFQGQLEGSIEHTRSLSIGKDGGVTGNIRAKFVIVEGRVDGDIFASESVSIRASAKVKGNIFAPRVGIADGANFSGSIDMKKRERQTRLPERGRGKGEDPRAVLEARAKIGELCRQNETRGRDFTAETKQ